MVENHLIQLARSGQLMGKVREREQIIIQNVTLKFKIIIFNLIFKVRRGSIDKFIGKIKRANSKKDSRQRNTF